MSDDKAREIEISQVTGIMGTKDGRAFLARILNFSGVDVDTFEKDPYIHARNAGSRSVGLWIRDEILTAAPDKYQLMLKELRDNEC